jgi:hypothetical protein
VTLLVVALCMQAGPVQANGTPIRIVLSHLNGVSNFGPQNATGVAELITSEGEVRLTAAGLQKLPDNEQYVLWITSAAANENLLLTPVNVGDGGVARVDVVLRSPIPEKPWDLMVLTVEAKGSTPPAPSDRRSIAGRFPSPGEGGAPRVLPNTGGDVPVGTPAAPVAGWFGLSGAGAALLILLLAGGVGYAIGRVGSRRGA